jgi:hypothetical protein
MTRLGLLASAALSLSLLAAPAAADVDPGPPNDCSDEGQDCDDAGTYENEDGVCASTDVKCEDGLGGPIDSPCLRCLTHDEAEAQGLGTDGDDDGGCSIGGRTRDLGVLGTMIAVGVVGVVVARRRETPVPTRERTASGRGRARSAHRVGTR